MIGLSTWRSIAIFIKEKLDASLVSFPFVSTKEQLADILTKGVFKKAFYVSLGKLGMIDVYAPTWGGVLFSKS